MIDLPYNRVLDYRLLTRDGQRKTLKIGFDRCPFDWGKALRKGLTATGGGRILVKPGASYQGLYFPDTAILRVRFIGRPWSTPTKNAATMVHELVHALDCLRLTYPERAGFHRALTGEVPEPYEGHPSDWRTVDRQTPRSSTFRWWSDDYKRAVGEALPEAFLTAFSDLPSSTWADSYPHPDTAVDYLLETLRPLIPA